MPRCQQRGDPRLGPAGLDGPGPPTCISVAGPVVPSSVVEGAKPGAVQLGAGFRAHLNPAEKLRQFLRGLEIKALPGCGRGLMQAHESEVRRVEKVAERIAVLLDQRRLLGPVLLIRLRRPISTALGRANLLAQRARFM